MKVPQGQRSHLGDFSILFTSRGEIMFKNGLTRYLGWANIFYPSANFSETHDAGRCGEPV
jgi:hypothetical protein